MSQQSTIRVVHASPGRLRIKAPALHQNEPLARQIEALGSLPGIQRVASSTCTGSVLITYNPAELRAFSYALMRQLQQEFPDYVQQDSIIVQLDPAKEISSRLRRALQSLDNCGWGIGDVSLEASTVRIAYCAAQLNLAAVMQHLHSIFINKFRNSDD